MLSVGGLSVRVLAEVCEGAEHRQVCCFQHPGRRGPGAQGCAVQKTSRRNCQAAGAGLSSRVALCVRDF